jgi:hypothetical protein
VSLKPFRSELRTLDAGTRCIPSGVGGGRSRPSFPDHSARRRGSTPPAVAARLVLLVALCSWLLPVSSQAQSARSSLEVYDEGPVWHMIYVRTAPGQKDTYLEMLSGIWTRQVGLAEEMGFVVDHKVLTKWASAPEDWNVLIIEIFPNMASYDSFRENWAKVDAAVVPDEADQKRAQADVNAIRTTLGVQIAREVLFESPPTE